MKKTLMCLLMAAALSVGVLPMTALAQTADEELSMLEGDVRRSAEGAVYLQSAQESNPMLSVSSNGTSVVDKPQAKQLASVAKVSPIAKQVYTGAQIKPLPVVTTITGATRLVKDRDYIVSYGVNKNVGSGIVTVTGKGLYSGQITVRFTIAKAPNTITKVTRSKTLNASKLKKRKQTFRISAITKDNASKSFKRVTVSKKAAKYVSVNSQGKVSVSRGLKKGTYKLRVKITAGATSNYKKTITTRTIKLVVK
ncbi:MAG: hypothetical protein IKG22_06640 [Atopobiaceae bacterium]|nr:hypothetical protein [Atopobiaceae bacterium]